MKRRIKRTIKTLKAKLGAAEPRSSLRDQGDQARNLGDWRAAADQYRRHLKARPDDFDIWVQLGHAEKETGRHAEAEAAYVAAALLRPRDADLWLMRGHLARLRGDEGAAARHYSESHAINADPRAAQERDLSLQRLKAPAEARPAVAPPADSRIGAIERIEGARLTGWVRDADAPVEIELEVLVDGEAMLTTKASKRRSDGLGRMGFDIDLTSVLDLEAEPRLDLRLARTGQSLDGAPVTLRLPSALREWMQRPKAPAGRTGAAKRTPGLSFILLEPWDKTRDAALLDALKAQTRSDWELIGAAEAGTADPGRTDRRLRLEPMATQAGSSERLTRLTAAAKAPWLVFLPGGMRPEPELAARLLEAADSDADVILADVALHGPNPEAPASFAAAPAWSFETFLADLAQPRVAAVRASLATPTAEPLDAEAPCHDLILRACDKARVVTQIPALLARAPARPELADPAMARIATAAISRRNLTWEVSTEAGGGLIVTPKDDGQALLVVVEADERLDAMEARLRRAADEAGPGGKVVLIDSYDRTSLELQQFEALAELCERLACTPEDRTHVLNDAVRNHGGQIALVALIGEGVTPEAGAVRRLSAWASTRPGLAVATGVVANAAGQTEGVGFIIGDQGGLGPAWPGKPLSAAGDDGRRARRCSGAKLDLAVVDIAVFTSAGGFNPELTGLWRDIDLALRLETVGRTVLVDPGARAQRTGDAPRLDVEVGRRFRRRWSERLARPDPFYSPLLSSNLDHRAGALDYAWFAARATRLDQPPGAWTDALPRPAPRCVSVAA